MSAPAPFDLPPELLEATAALLEAPEGEREAAFAALLAAHPDHAATLRAFLQSLLRSSNLLDQALTAPPTTPTPVFDGYRTLRLLGEGAFGSVYLCEQPPPMPRQVAIKLLRPGAGDRSTLARFDAERRFLARLGHPAIAQIFDTGLLADGRPWFVMEHVPGLPLTEYCDRGRLPIEARLRLFVRLCHGVQHAHGHGIVHRDLKPANVLVVEVDGEAQPKIIDFGIARALERPAADGAARTETGRVVGTPGYMSPEQMSGDPAAIDARSDVFSLGVVLYELLTGELPWGKRPTTTDSEPPRPSVRVTTHDRRGATVAQQRGSQPKKLAARLRGDLDWIVLKALAREPERRFATVLELAADVERHLRSEAVHAGPPALRYRLRKFLRRHRTTVALGLAAVTLAALGLWRLDDYRATAADRTKDAEAAIASLLARANDLPLRNNANYVELRKGLGREAVALYGRLLAETPADAASRHGRMRALTTLSVLHFMVGEYTAAADAARQAMADGELLLAAAPDDAGYQRSLALASRYLGRALLRQGQPDAARPAYQRAADLCERLGTDAESRDLLVLALEGVACSIDQSREPARRAELLTRAAALQEANLRAHPDRLDLREESANVAILRASDAAVRGDFAAAKDLLTPAFTWLDDGRGLARGTVVKLHQLGAGLAVATADATGAAGHVERGLTATRAWMQAEPGTPQPLALANELLLSLGDLHAGDPTLEARTGPLRERVAICTEWLARFPEESLAVHPLIDSTLRLGEELLTTGRRQDLAGMDVAMRRACALLKLLPPSIDQVTRRTLAMVVQGSFGIVADALALPDAEAIWEGVAAALVDLEGVPLEDTAARRVMYGTRVAARRLAAGHLAEAEAMIAQTTTLMRSTPAADPEALAAELDRLRVVLAIRRHDLAAAEARADGLLAAARSWRDLAAATDASYRVWQEAREGPPGHAATWRDRTIAVGERAIEACRRAQGPDRDDPWTGLPLAKCRVTTALAHADRGDASPADAGEEVLAALAAWRDRVHADQWDEALYRDGLGAGRH